jgi:hypothetical protein
MRRKQRLQCPGLKLAEFIAPGPEDMFAYTHETLNVKAETHVIFDGITEYNSV